MTDCILQQLDDGSWWCPVCDVGKKELLPICAHRNCEATAERIKQLLEQESRITEKPKRQPAVTIPNGPPRDPAEAKRLYRKHCKDCDQNLRGCGNDRLCMYDHLPLPAKCESSTTECPKWTEAANQ